MPDVVSNFRGSSTNLNTNYLFSQFVPTITVKDSDGSKLNVLEPFNVKMGRAIEAVRPIAIRRYVNEPITTITFEQYNNTTAWWMVMLASKELHALAVENGKILTLPDINNIRRSTSQRFLTGVRIPVYVSI